MAEIAVRFVLNMLGSSIMEEVKLLGRVSGEVQYIGDELERMVAFISFADTMADSDPELKVWVKQVREVAYDIEYVLDEFTFHLARYHGHRLSSRFFRKINLVARHKIASKISSIKLRVVSISMAHQRCHYKFNAQERASSSTAANKTWYDIRGDAILIEEAELVGINKPRKELIKLIGEGESGLRVISVVGMGGLGKTTLVKKVYEDQDVKKCFQSHAWVNVSQSFNIEELLLEIIRILYVEINLPIPQGIDTMNSQRLKEILKEFLQHKSFVIVLDDIWSIHAWEAIKYALPDNNLHGRIMITTRFADIAASTSIMSSIFYLQPLPAEESWTLFCKKTFQDSSCPPHLRSLAEKILERCEGLPLAIVAIGSLLSSKDKSKSDEWEIVYRGLGAELETNDSLRNLMKILSLSYNHLPYFLKCCFLYWGIFPEDNLIESMRLIRLWIAEGFVEAKEGMTLEEVAESYLKELINRSLVQIADTTVDGRVRRCRVHDLVRENILSKSREINFFRIAGIETMEMHEKVQRLSIHYSCEDALQKRRFSHLRSLFVFGVRSFSNFSIFLRTFKLLKVLDLRGSPLTKFHKEIADLIHLRYLSLRKTKVNKIPKCIEKLQNLETLDLKYTFVCKLPVQVIKLKRLRHLLVYHYLEVFFDVPFGVKQGFQPPAGIGALTSLQKLCCIKLIQGQGVVRELGSLSQLRRLGIRDLRQEDGKHLCSSIAKMRQLRSLDVSSVSEEEFIDLDSLSSPPFLLQVLYLEGRLKKLPSWLPALHNLARIRLESSKLNVDPLEGLKDLPNLVELELHDAYDGTESHFEAGGFQKLKRLWLGKLENLVIVHVDMGAMPCLQKLSIDHCENLRLPINFHHLFSLKLLQFYGMYAEFRETLLFPSEENNWITEYVPKVSFVKVNF